MVSGCDKSSRADEGAGGLKVPSRERVEVVGGSPDVDRAAGVALDENMEMLDASSDGALL